MKKCVWYVRVSTQRQETERQKTSMKNFAKQNWLNLVRIFEDKISWRKYKYEERKGFIELQSYLKENKDVKILLLDELSRLGRNDIETSATKVYFRKNNIILYIWWNKYDLNDDENNLLFNILNSISSYEIWVIKKRSNTWRRDTLLSWHTLFSIKPYWYEIVNAKIINWVKERQHIEVIEDEAKNIKKIFELIWIEKKSIWYVISYLKEKNILSPTWKKIWPISSIKNILKNKLYYWEWVYRLKIWTINYKTPSIITKELYYKVQDQLKENFNTKINPTHLENFLFKNILFTNCDWKLKMLQTHFEKSKDSSLIRWYRSPERNLKSFTEEWTFIRKRTSLISVLDSNYIEKVILFYIWYILVNSDFFEKENLLKLKELTNTDNIENLNKLLLKKEKELTKLNSLSLVLNTEITSLKRDLEDESLTDITKIKITKNLYIQEKTLNNYIDNIIVIEKEIDEIKKEIENAEENNKKFDEFKDIKKWLKFIKKKEIENIISSKKILDTKVKLLKYISKIEINDNKEMTQKFRNLIWSLKSYWIYIKWNELLKKIFFSVYNRNKEKTFIKNNAYVIDIIFHFTNWVKHKLTILYNHKDPNLYFPTNYEELISKLWWDKNSKDEYRKIFESFQTFNIK
jgi:hypothetical protein